jgi:3-oxoacyl-[acyl-carrier-protein] synthase I
LVFVNLKLDTHTDMNRVVVTGRGLVTPLGVGLPENEAALRAGKSGIVTVPEFVDLGLPTTVAGVSEHEPECPFIDRRNSRFMTANSRMAAGAVWQALEEAGLDIESLKNYKTAIIGGCAGSSYKVIHDSAATYENSGGRLRSLSPLVVPKVMPSSAIASLSLILGITGESYDISCACASGTVSIMNATRLLQAGLYDMIFCGGSEEIDWVLSIGFNAIRALGKDYNDRPAQASRPFDRDRDGFILGEGAGYMILETEECALRRGARPISIIEGYSANCNANDMVVPDAPSSAKVMADAVANAGLNPSDISYVNTHGTATPVGDPIEIAAVRRVFGDEPAVNSTKSMTGHMIGATGAVEAIYCSMMMEKKFLCPSINLENPEAEFEGVDFIRETRENVDIKHCITNSFAFGGSNVCLVMAPYTPPE